jgi:hypothetical protein
MFILLAAAVAQPAEPERVSYYCRRSKSPVEFSLIYERQGSQLRNVQIADRDSPRLAPDRLTRWRAEPTHEGVNFKFNVVRNGLWTSGKMTLVRVETQPSHFRLTWSSSMGGKGSDLVFDSGEQTADCVVA